MMVSAEFDSRNCVRIASPSIRLMTLDLRDIEYFAMVAQHGHLGRAAEALGLGQPALSMSLRRLEKSAQVKLVKRTPKGVELTAVGAALLSHASKLRLAREDLAREVADLAQGRAGHVRIGASPSNVDVDLPEACSRLLMEAPKVTVNVAVLENDALLPALRKGDLDIAITHTHELPQADIAIESVREDEFVVYCASRHRLAKRRSITLHDLAKERWSAATSASGAFGPLAVLREAFEERGLPAPQGDRRLGPREVQASCCRALRSARDRRRTEHRRGGDAPSLEDTADQTRRLGSPGCRRVSQGCLSFAGGTMLHRDSQGDGSSAAE